MTALLFGGRRKLPQAGEVRRPRGPAWCASLGRTYGRMIEERYRIHCIQAGAGIRTGAPGLGFSKEMEASGGVAALGASGAVSSWAFRLRDRSCARTAGTMFFNADEPAFCPDGAYSQVFRGFLKCTRTAGTMNLHGRTCSRTPRVAAICIIGSDAVRGRGNF